MGKNYGHKLLERRGQPADEEEKPPQTILEFAQETAAYSSFGKFILAGKTSANNNSVTLFFGDTLFVYTLDEQVGSRIFVMKTENPLLYEGAFVYTRELEQLARDGTCYRLRSGIHPDTESVRKEIFDRLLEAIKADGGHHKVLETINNGLEKIEMEEKRKQGLIRAERIFTAISSGELKSDPLLLFKGKGILGFGFDSMPKVFILEYQHTRDGDRLFITLDAAPLGTGGEFSLGTSIQVSHIFHTDRFYSEEEKNVKSMARYFIRLFGKSACLDEAKYQAGQLGVSEGWIDSQNLKKPQGIDRSIRAHVSPDSGMVIHYTSHGRESSCGQTVH